MNSPLTVMAGLDPAIQLPLRVYRRDISISRQANKKWDSTQLVFCGARTRAWWMAASRAAMTNWSWFR